MSRQEWKDLISRVMDFKSSNRSFDLRGEVLVAIYDSGSVENRPSAGEPQ
jgi:hypothetical protein